MREGQLSPYGNHANTAQTNSCPLEGQPGQAPDERVSCTTAWAAATSSAFHLALSDSSDATIVSSERIRAELGYAEPMEHSEALQGTIAWTRAHAPSTETCDYSLEDACWGPVACSPPVARSPVKSVPSSPLGSTTKGLLCTQRSNFTSISRRRCGSVRRWR